MRASDDRQRRRAEEERQRRAREAARARSRIDKGRWFHLGMAAKRGETRENGWVTEFQVNTLHGRRRLDTARVHDERNRHFAEYKSGRTPEKDALEQLKKDRELLEQGWCGTWVRVEGVNFGRSVEKELKKLERDFRDQFDVVFVTEQEAREAIQRGQELERRHQRELFSGAELRAREERKRRLERLKEAERTRAAAAQAIEKKKQREREEQERRRARELAAAEQARQQRAREEQERQQQAREQSATAEQARAREREESDRAAAQQRERQAREAYERARLRLPREVSDLLARSYPVPGDEVRGGPGPHAGHTRAGRAERSRDPRERGGRERQ